MSYDSRPSSPPKTIRGNLVMAGWLEKYSVGRSLIPWVKNWKNRWVVVTHTGLSYSPGPECPAEPKMHISFVSTALDGTVRMNPVYLYSVITAAIHPEATDGRFSYFGVQFIEKGTPRTLLLRTKTPAERATWVRFIAQFVHAASTSGVPCSHPLLHGKQYPDPEELCREQQENVRKHVVEWDDGSQFRWNGGMDEVRDPVASNWDSDEEPCAEALGSSPLVDVASARRVGGGPPLKQPPKLATPVAKASPQQRKSSSGSSL